MDMLEQCLVQRAIYLLNSFALAREYLRAIVGLMASEWAIEGNDLQLLRAGGVNN